MDEREAWIECLVRAGVGLALMPEHSLVSEDTVRRPLCEPPVTRRVAVLRSAEHALSPAAQRLWETMLGRVHAPLASAGALDQRAQQDHDPGDRSSPWSGLRARHRRFRAPSRSYEFGIRRRKAGLP